MKTAEVLRWDYTAYHPDGKVMRHDFVLAETREEAIEKALELMFVSELVEMAKYPTLLHRRDA